MDSFYYKPDFVKLEKIVLSISQTKLRYNILSITGGATPLKSESEKYYTDSSGYPLLRVQNITEEGLFLEDLIYINHKTHNEYLKRSKVFSDDLLVTITGRIASSTVVPEGFEGNINQHSVVIKTKSKKLSELLATYLNSNVGNKIALRRTTGGTRPALDYKALKNLPIIFNEEAIYVMAEAYRNKKITLARSHKLLNSIDNYLLKELGIKLPEEKRNELKERVYIKSSKYLSEGRFDAPCNQYNWNLKTNKFSMVRLQKYVRINPKTNFKNLNNDSLVTFVPMELVSEDGEIDYSEQDYIFNSKGYTCFKENDLLWAKITPCMENGKSTVARNLLNRYGFGSTEFHVFRIINQELDINYLFELFHLKYFRKMAKLQFGGSAGHQRVPPDFFKSLYIPLPPLKKQQQIAEYIGEIRVKAKQIREIANKELEKAKKDVEKMILS